MCQLSPVAFHGDTIFCVDYHGEPYTPMKPIIENMGLQWGAQAAKLRANKERWGITMIVIPSQATMSMIDTVAKDGKEREMLCMPVRKLPAYLASINPKKVKPELRAKIELYQAESDDALWNYWMNGKAERPAGNGEHVTDSADAALTAEQQCALRNIVDAKVLKIAGGSDPRRRVYYMQVWNRFKNHFRIAKYEQLPQSKLAEAISYLVRMEITDKAVSQQQELPVDPTPPVDPYEAYAAEVEAARKRVEAEIARLLSLGLRLIDPVKFGVDSIQPWANVFHDWLYRALTSLSEVNVNSVYFGGPITLAKQMAKVLPASRR